MLAFPAALIVAPLLGSTDREAARGVSIAKYSYERNDFGDISASFTFKNANSYPVKDLQLTCIAFSKTQTPLGSRKKTIYEFVGAKKIKRVVGVKLGHAGDDVDSIACHVDMVTRQP